MIACSYLGHLGRLGNMLWEIASTIGLAEREMEDFGFNRWDYEPYFSVPKFYFYDKLPDGYKSAPNLDMRLHPSNRPYLQDYELFRGCADLVRTLLKPSELSFLHMHQAYPNLTDYPRPWVSMHVRRTDHLDKYIQHPVLPIRYYENACDALDINPGTIMIFSDDIQWCRDNMEAPQMMYMQGSSARPKDWAGNPQDVRFNDYIDLTLMSMCDAHIIANSSYSWWGAFLSGSNNVAFPWPFYGQNMDATQPEFMIVPEWKVVEY